MPRSRRRVVAVAHQAAASGELRVRAELATLAAHRDLALLVEQVAGQELAEPRLRQQPGVERRVSDGRGLQRPEAAELHAGLTPEEVARHGVGVLGPAVLHGEVERREPGELLGDDGLEPLRARAPEDHELWRRRQAADQVDLDGAVVAGRAGGAQVLAGGETRNRRLRRRREREREEQEHAGGRGHQRRRHVPPAPSSRHVPMVRRPRPLRNRLGTGCRAEAGRRLSGSSTGERA